jgi:HK97 family phage major capsid protein
MGALVSQKAGERIDFELSNVIIRGTGVGQPLGILNANALVTQSAESSQVADTLVAENVVKMAARMPAASRRNAIWLVHPDAEPQLPLMTIGDQPVYVGPGGFRDDPYGRLLGRPVIPHQTAETLGDLGDLMFCDFMQYLTAVKQGGLRSETGPHGVPLHFPGGRSTLVVRADDLA